MVSTPARVQLPGWPLWLLLALPSAWLLWAAGQLGADLDELTNLSGQAAVILLVAAIASTGAARLLPRPQALIRHRRALGLAGFGTSIVHLLLYFGAMGDVRPIIAELDAPGIWTGWAALALLVPLALTSSDAAMRRLGRGWKRLQRLVWPAAGLALAHTFIVHDGQSLALILAAVLVIFQLYRITLGRTAR